MNTIPGFFNIIRSLANAFVTALILIIVCQDVSLGQNYSVRIRNDKKILLGKTGESLSFARDSVYRVIEQVKTGPNAGIDTLLLIDYNSNVYGVSLVNFRNSGLAEIVDNLLTPSAIDLELSKNQELDEKIQKLQSEKADFESSLTIWQSVTGLLAILFIAGGYIFFRVYKELARIKGQIVTIKWIKNFGGLSKLGKTFGSDPETLELLNPEIDFGRLRGGEELLLRKQYQSDSTPLANLGMVLQKELIKTAPTLAEAIQQAMSNSSAPAKSKISESDYQRVTDENKALTDAKQKVMQEAEGLRIKTQELESKLHAETIEKDRLSLLRQEFIDVRDNKKLMQFARSAGKLLDGLSNARMQVLKLADSLASETDPYVLNLVSALFVKYQNGYNQLAVDNWSKTIGDLNTSQRLYTHAFSKKYPFKEMADDELPREFMRAVQQELFQDYLSQTLVLCGALAKISSFKGVPASLSGLWESQFHELAKNLVADASQAGLFIQYLEMGASVQDLETIVGDNWNRISTPQWPFTETTTGKNRVIQVIKLGYQDTMGVSDSKAKIVMDV